MERNATRSVVGRARARQRPLAADHPSSLCTQLLVYKNASYTLELRKKIAAQPQNKVLFIAKGGARHAKHGKFGWEIGCKICPAPGRIYLLTPPHVFSPERDNLLTYPPDDIRHRLT